ncbi:Metallo-dependent phosphatase [Russula earlei]|uniref:Metallo-dependent phosphatase n=1 Tax=Russula earlei TaxID=71964 RepID=A0ACC0UK74_9AGAM|nr:Metallo-dependent phosphatase [Russula earlei]
MTRVRRLLVCAVVAWQACVASSLSYGPPSYTLPGAFPTSLYSSYYNDPTATSAQPQPVVSDRVLHKIYPPELTNPNNLPKVGHVPFWVSMIRKIRTLSLPPPPANISCKSQKHRSGGSAITITPPSRTTRAGAAKPSSKSLSSSRSLRPEQGPAFFVFLCQQYSLSSACQTTYGATSYGPVLTQVLANADVQGYDGQMICQNFIASSCPLPSTPPLNLTGWFSRPKPDPLPPAKQPSGQRLKVLHVSDFHLDPLIRHTRSQAAILQAIPVLTGTADTGFAWTLFTGDLVAHDPGNQMSRDLVMYTETVVYDLLKRTLGSGPVYATLGNHDSYTMMLLSSLGGALAKQFSWSVFPVCLSFIKWKIENIRYRNYDHVASLWKLERWLPQSVVAQARTHYAAYSVQRTDGLRVISLNTDLWYRGNYFNYINLSIPDTSGMLRFLTDELQDAEDVGDRVWIIGHVPTGWDGSNPLEAPSNLFYQIVDRFSPHVIANIFFGHDHEDQFSIFYANNGTEQNAQTALTTSWLGPSITPLRNLNSGFRVYEVDSATFDVVDAHTWRSDVNSFPGLDGQTEFGPSYVYEYSTRAAYGTNINWDANAPLNATWWHLVTEEMEKNIEPRCGA